MVAFTADDMLTKTDIKERIGFLTAIDWTLLTKEISQISPTDLSFSRELVPSKFNLRMMVKPDDILSPPRKTLIERFNYIAQIILPGRGSAKFRGVVLDSVEGCLRLALVFDNYILSYIPAHIGLCFPVVFIYGEFSPPDETFIGTELYYAPDPTTELIKLSIWADKAYHDYMIESNASEDDLIAFGYYGTERME